MEKHKRPSLRFSPSPPCSNAILAASLTCYFLLTARLHAQESPPPETQKVRGTVINSVTHEPISRALVYSADNRFAAFSDSEGHFEFTIPAPPALTPEGRSLIQVVNSRLSGMNLLIARKPGFLEETIQRMRPDPSAKDLTISLVPEALIIGHVVLPSSEPPDRIQVQLYRRQVRDGRAHWEMQSNATSRSTGEFRFAELRAGAYKLLTTELLDRDPLTFNPQGPQFGYPPAYFPPAGDFVSAQTIELSPGKTFEASITLVKQPYYPVKVAVANLKPGAGMQVLVYAHGHRGPGYSLGAGNHIEGLLPNGTYTLEAASIVRANSMAGSANITVKGAPLEAALVLAPGGSIAVNVKEEFTGPQVNTGSAVEVNGSSRDSLSTPRRYLNIYLEATDDFSLRQGASLPQAANPGDEPLVIENVVPGRYWVKVNSARGFVSSITCGGGDLQHQPLVVTGGSSPPIELTMRDDWAEVDGTVEGISTSVPEAKSAPSDAYVSGTSAYVYLVPLPDGSGESREAWVGLDGKLNAQQLPPGVYRVLVFDHQQPELEYYSAEAMRAYESKGQVVRMVGNQKEHLRLQLITTGE